MASETGQWSDLRFDGRLARFALLCLGIWLNAADALVTSTIMPSVARAIGGYAFFAWPVIAYLLGSIVAGASAGRLTGIAGLRAALFWAAVLYAAGCAVGALAPSMAVFVAGRLLQGVGAGWIVGLVYGAVSNGFPKALWSRVLAAVSGVWGVATLLGPLIGGVFAQSGSWRLLFWLFAAQSLAFAAAVLALVPQAREQGDGSSLPLARPALLAASVVLIGIAGLVPHVLSATGMIAGGCALLLLFLHRDARAAVHLLPPQLADPASVSGTGYRMMFLESAASVGFGIYGTALLQRIYALSPLAAGYAIGAEAMGWTLCALFVAGRPEREHGLYIRGGAGCVVAALLLLGVAIPSGNLAFVIVCGFLLGGGFGLFWSFAAQRIFASLPEAERTLGASAVPAVQIVGNALGAATSGTLANLLGMAAGMDLMTAHRIGAWLFFAMVPLALGGWFFAQRLATQRSD
ncbi:MAG TPA: MFS transporter [Rhizomicrobium sp.]